MTKQEPPSPPPSPPDRRLAEAAALLAERGLRREAIDLVERALHQRCDPDTLMLLALLLRGSERATDVRVAVAHLRRLQWMLPREPSRPNTWS